MSRKQDASGPDAPVLAYDPDDILRIPPTQIRLITHRHTDRHVEAYLRAPAGWVSVDPTTKQRTRQMFDAAVATAFARTRRARLGWIFVVPREERSIFFSVRHLRFTLAKPDDDPSKLIKALGHSESDGTDAAAKREVDSQDTAGGLQVEATAQLPIAVSLNDSKLTFNDHAVEAGSTQLTQQAYRIQRDNRVNTIYLPHDQAAVRLTVRAEQIGPVFGITPASAAMNDPLWLEDALSQPWYPIGYVWKRADYPSQIVMDRARPIQEAGELPLARMLPGESLSIYFAVHRGTRLRAVRLGGQIIEPIDVLADEAHSQ